MLKIFVTSTGKTSGAIKLKHLSGIYLLLKEFCFEEFVNHSMGNSFMNKSSSRCDFQWENFICTYQQLTARLIILLIFEICNKVESIQAACT